MINSVSIRELTHDFSPEQLLQLGILEEAINDLNGLYSSQSAHRWIFQESGRDDPFSFQGVCRSLGLDADWIRVKLSELANGNAAKPLRRNSIASMTAAVV